MRSKQRHESGVPSVSVSAPCVVRSAPVWLTSVDQHGLRYGGRFSPAAYTLSELMSGVPTIPPWQREPCWSPDQQRAYVRCVLTMVPPAPLILRRVEARDVVEVIDGQQRLTALGLIKGRTTAARIDPLTGEWSESGWSVGEMVEWAWRGADRWLRGQQPRSVDLDDTQNAAVEVGGVLGRLNLMAQIFEPYVSAEQIAEVLRAVAVSGVIPTRDEVERMVAGVMGVSETKGERA